MPLPTDRRPDEAKQKAPADNDFPVKGLDVNWAYKAQPQGTTPACLNVRPYDATGQRLRGGQRAGISKWIATQPNGTHPIQRMIYLPPQTVGVASQVYPVPVTYGSSLTGTPGSVLNAQPDFNNGILVSSPSALMQSSTTQPLTGTTGMYPTGTTSSGVILNHNLTGASFSLSVGTAMTQPPNGGVGMAMATSTIETSIFASLIHDTLPVPYTAPTFSVSLVTRNLSSGWSGLFPPKTPGSSYYTVQAQVPGGSPIGATIEIPSGNMLSTTMKFVYNQPTGSVKVYVGGALIGTTSTTTYEYAIYPGVACIASPSTDPGTGATIAVGQLQVTDEGAVPGGGSSNGYPGSHDDGSGNLVYTPYSSNGMILAVSNGSVYSGYTGAPWSAISGGSGAVSSVLNRVRMTVDFGKVYFCDGTNAGYRIYDPVANTVSSWTAAVAASGAGTLPTNNPAGPLAPINTLGCTIITTWRGRVVMSGLASDPQNWFMSAAADETPTGFSNPIPATLNWNYGELPFVGTSPVAGNNSNAGLLGDVITALAPFNDDIMVMGGVQSIWLMHGDPAENGRIDCISHEVGIIGPDAWCIDQQGTMYFFGSGTFYRMSPPGPSTMYQKTLGGMPEALSQGRMDSIFNQVNAQNSEVLLLWDELLKGVHIYITPLDNSPTIHYWWDQRTDGFWPEQYPTNCDPTSVLNFKSADSTARADLLGGFDGYVRQVDATSSNDDGNPINSFVKLAPMTPGSTHQNSRINRITTVLDSTSDPVTVNVYAAQSPEEVVGATSPAWSYTASPTNRYGIPRIQGNSILLEIANNSPLGYTWALESLNVVSAITGRTRHGRI